MGKKCTCIETGDGLIPNEAQRAARARCRLNTLVVSSLHTLPVSSSLRPPVVRPLVFSAPSPLLVLTALTLGTRPLVMRDTFPSPTTTSSGCVGPLRTVLSPPVCRPARHHLVTARPRPRHQSCRRCARRPLRYRGARVVRLLGTVFPPRRRSSSSATPASSPLRRSSTALSWRSCSSSLLVPLRTSPPRLARMAQSRQQRLAPFFVARSAAGPQPAFGSLAHLVNPYPGDAPGDAYFLRRDSRAIRRAYKKNKISRARYLAAAEVKIGHSKNLARRRRGYRRCERDWRLTVPVSTRVAFQRPWFMKIAGNTGPPVCAAPA
ncbi:hypothetical protein C8R47DRAFT_1221302 [Mycena vitilis]|nr:hypothetical protein C8R47DRAFT_1221302 [Mycena vitilis]